jgi:hypothetical protein
MESSQSENLLKIPGAKIFQSSFKLKTNVPDPFPGPILMIPPSDPQRLQRPEITGLDLSHVSPLYIPRNMHIPLGDLYKLFELKPYRKDNESQSKGHSFENDNQMDVGIGEDMTWNEENEMILTHSGKRTLKRILDKKEIKLENRMVNHKQEPSSHMDMTLKSKIQKKVIYNSGW